MIHRATQLVWLVSTQCLFLFGIQIETVLTHESWWISWTIVFDLQIFLVLPGSQLSFTEMIEYICSRWPYPTLMSFTLVSSFAPPYTFVRSWNCTLLFRPTLLPCPNTFAPPFLLFSFSQEDVSSWEPGSAILSGDLKTKWLVMTHMKKNRALKKQSHMRWCYEVATVSRID